MTAEELGMTAEEFGMTAEEFGMTARSLASIAIDVIPSRFCEESGDVSLDHDQLPDSSLSFGMTAEEFGMTSRTAGHHSSLRSRKSGFMDLMGSTFFARDQPLICFSRAIASDGPENSLK